MAILLLAAAPSRCRVLALKPAAEPAPAPCGRGRQRHRAAADGLPTPEQALSDKPLVSLAVLDDASDLGQFESKDPFKPIEKVSADGASARLRDVRLVTAGARRIGRRRGPQRPGRHSGSGGGGSGGGGGGGSDQRRPPRPGPDTPEQTTAAARRPRPRRS